MRRLLALGCALALMHSVHGQFGFERSNHIPVSVGGNALRMPWAGGLNYAQFSQIDMNFDGRPDLFVFDRSDDQIRVFLSLNDGTGNYFQEAPQYRTAFPPNMRYRTALVDYNQDGLPDIFTYGIGGVTVYRNVGNSSTGHQWVLEKNLLFSDYYGTQGNLYVSSSDLPAIVDVDGDGDIDILTFHIGGDRLEYHKNMSMELYGVPDSLVYVLRNECWGNFREDESTNSIILNSNVFPCGSAGGNVPNPEFVLPDEQRDLRHAGSTVLALDMTNSGLLDIVLGDIAFPNLVLLTNGGNIPNTNSTMVAVDYNFPSNTTSSNLSLFPAGFFVDADHDGVRDLLVCPNAKIVSENQRSIWRYRNLGTNAQPNFVFQQNDFLQNQMIDAGSGSVPVLVDVNGDGLQDLLLANFFNYKAPLDKESKLMYFQNTGTAAQPAFTFVSDNRFNLTALGLGLRIIPTFGDLDGDGDLDMLVGADNGRLHYFENTAGPGMPMNFAAPITNLTDASGIQINVGSFSAPFIADIDRDGLPDLLIGNKNGTIRYYRNTGTASAFQFTLMNATWGQVNVSTGSPDGYAVPFVIEVNDSWHLFVGSRNGKFNYFTDIEENMEEGAVFTNLSAGFGSIDVNGYSAFAMHDLDGDGNLELFVGTDLGGVELFEADPNSSVSIPAFPAQPEVHVFPNPFAQQLTIQGLPSSGHVTWYTLQGAKVRTDELNAGSQVLDVSQLPRGVYLIEITSDRYVYRKTLIK
jgi:hypothetical protein